MGAETGIWAWSLSGSLVNGEVRLSSVDTGGRIMLLFARLLFSDNQAGKE